MSALFAKNVQLILFLPMLTAVVLVALPGYRLSARINVASALPDLFAALSLFICKPASGRYLLVDDLNIVFVVLNTFVAFTTSVFSASYIAHELETGRLTETHLRFYHTMYQVLLGAMNLALVANNIGLMWVAIEVGDADHGAHGRDLSHRIGRSKPRGNISFWAASASRWLCSAPS